MKTITENFSNPSFGTIADVVHTATAKEPIRFPAKAHGPGYTNTAVASDNLP